MLPIGHEIVSPSFALRTRYGQFHRAACLGRALSQVRRHWRLSVYAVTPRGMTLMTEVWPKDWAASQNGFSRTERLDAVLILGESTYLSPEDQAPQSPKENNFGEQGGWQ